MFKKLFAILAVVILAGSFAMPSLAAPTFNKVETATTDKAFDDDAYFVGESVTIAKDIRGDLIIGGGNITVNANVTGDVWVMGGTVAINGRIGDDLRVFSGNVAVTKEVVDDVIVGAGTLVISDTATIRGDFWGGVGDLSIYGRILGSLSTWAGTVRINGTIDGKASIRYSEVLTFGNNARIKGQLDYYAGVEDPSFANFASKAVFHQIVEPKVTEGLGSLMTFAGITVVLWKWLSFLILGAMLIWIYPKYFPRVIDGIKARDHSSSFVWMGLLFMVAVPALAMVFAITLVGLPLTFLMLIIYALMLVLGAIVGAYGVGSYLRRHKHDNEWDQLGNLALGVLVTLLIGYIPLLGWLFSAAVMLFGIGAVWHEKNKILAVYKHQ